MILLSGALALVGPALTPAEAQFKVPDGWVASPQNTKAAGEAGFRILHKDTGIELVYVPAGKFTMGASEDDIDRIWAANEWPADEKDSARAEQPAHEVTVKGFWIGCTEVTNGQWRKIMGSLPEDDTLGDSYPVMYVSWNQAAEFCKKLGLRLPTEAEWEYAARGPQSKVFPWGSDWDKTRCCNDQNTGPEGMTYPVGSFAKGASWCGALDMAGNVGEMCQDWYSVTYYMKSPKADPPGPTEEEATTTLTSGDGGKLSNVKGKVLRGGSWYASKLSRFRCSARGVVDPAKGYCYAGFRVAM
jgi:iron(II)-dependent oxidoreductase